MHGVERNPPRSLSRLPGLALRGTTPELVGQRFVLGGKVQRYGVDAVAQARGRRAVAEDVPLVAAAAGAEKLGTHHAVARVVLFTQVIVVERRREARPAGAAVEFLPAQEQGQAAEPVGEDPRALLVQESATERRLRAVTEQHVG